MVWYLGSFEVKRLQNINLSPHNRICLCYLNLRVLHYNSRPSGLERNGTFSDNAVCGVRAGLKLNLIRRCHWVLCWVNDGAWNKMIYTTFPPSRQCFQMFFFFWKKAWVLKVIFDYVFLNWVQDHNVLRAASHLPPAPLSHVVDSCLNFHNLLTSECSSITVIEGLYSDLSEGKC